MRDPKRRLQLLPWGAILQVSGITSAIVGVLEFLILLGYGHSDLIRRALSILYGPPLGEIVSFAAAVGVGAMAVNLLERFYHQKVLINAASLWALVPCLALALFLKSLLLIPPFIVDLSEIQLMAIIVGIFWKGRPYWR